MSSLFDNVLKNDETLFKNELALDSEYMPKIIPYREGEQKEIVLAIKPLFYNRSGKNMLVHGPSGIGKTLASKYVLKEASEKGENILPIYINNWQKNTSYKIIVEICEQMGYKFSANKKTEELFAIIKKQLNKESVIFCFDEIDKVESFDFIYTIIEEIYKKSIILITNYKDSFQSIDPRIKSRLNLCDLPFKKYTATEIKGILTERINYAFFEGVFAQNAIDFVVRKTFLAGDVRVGLHLLKEGGNNAENRSSKKIELKDVERASVQTIKIKKPEMLTEQDKKILEIVKNNSGKRIGELFLKYKDSGEKSTYKTFQRRIEFLNKNKYVSTKKMKGGPEGNTTLVEYGSGIAAQQKLKNNF